MKSKTILMPSIAVAIVMVASVTVTAYPPAVGILGKSQNCLKCHVDNGKWVDGPDLIIDIVEKATKKSLRQPDGSFLLTAKRNQGITVLTIIGFRTDNEELIPYRNAWLYTDPERIKGSTLSKLPPGWEANLPMACRIVGDKLETYPDAHITVLPMTLRPTDSASDGTVTLQVMLTAGETVKGNARKGMVGSYFERTVHLKVVE